MTSVVASGVRRQVAGVGVAGFLSAFLLCGLVVATGCKQATQPSQTPGVTSQQSGPVAQLPDEQTTDQQPAATPEQPESAGQTPETPETAGQQPASPEQPPAKEPGEQPGEQPAPQPPEQPESAQQAAGQTPAETPEQGGEPAEQQPSEPGTQETPAGEELAQAGGEEPSAGGAPSARVEGAEGMDYVDVPAPAFMPDPVPLPEAEATTEDEMKPYTETIPGTDVKFEMVPIRGGKFVMGSPESEEGRNEDEGPQHEVVVEPFWMGKYEVTWNEYELWAMKLDIERRRVLNQEPTPQDKIADAVAMPTPPYTDMTFGMGKDGYPAICMTQFAAKMYCKWLSAKTGRYYRLPTEAEWEYACRAGTTTAYSFGDDPKDLDEYAWYFDNSDDKYHKVGQKKPNPWGLYDMHGNVAEWVLDQHLTDYYAQLAGKVTRNPLALPTKIYPRVVRGGSWDSDPEQLRSAARMGSTPDWKMQDPQIPQSVWYLTDANFVGFRVVRPLRKPTPEEAKRYEVDEAQLRDFVEWLEAEAGKF